jgi:hypothetical protein
MQRTHWLWFVATVAMVVVLLAPTAGGAMTMDSREGGAFSCRARATKLGDEITITFWLNTTHAGRRWQIRVWDNGVLLLSRTRVTGANGNIRVRAGTQNLPHQDVFRFRATSKGSGSSCRVDDLRV